MKTIYAVAVVAAIATIFIGVTVSNNTFATPNVTGVQQLNQNQEQRTQPYSATDEDKATNGDDDRTEGETNDDSNDYVDAKLASQAQISPDQAKAIASSHVSAQISDIKSIDLDYENGHLVYSVDIIKANHFFDITVDAMNGKVVNVDQGTDEGPDGDGDGETNDDNATSDGPDGDGDGEQPDDSESED